jgi:hypothetical protein
MIGAMVNPDVLYISLGIEQYIYIFILARSSIQLVFFFKKKKKLT